MPLGTRRLGFARQRPLASAFSKLPSQHNNFRPTAIARAPWEILPFQLIVETQYFPSKAWRAGFLAAFCDANPAKAPVGPPAGISSRLCSRTTTEIPLYAGGRPKHRLRLASGRPGPACSRRAGDAAHRIGLRARKVTNIRLPNPSYPLNSPPLRSLAKVQKYRPPSAQRTKEDRFFIWPLERPFLKSKSVCFTPYCPPLKGRVTKRKRKSA